MLNGLRHAQAEQVLIGERSDGPLLVAAIDLQAFGLLNQALGPRIGNLVVDLVAASLTATLSALPTPFWNLSFGDEHYFLARVAALEVDPLAAAFEAAVAAAARALDGRFAPIHIAWAGPGGDRPVLLPQDAHEALGRIGVLSSAVASGARFDALVRLADDRDVAEHARILQSQCQGRFIVTAHDLYGSAQRDGCWRLPFPRLRLALGLATGTASALTADQALDFILQELQGAIQQARRDGIPMVRHDFVLGQPAFLDQPARHPSRVPSDVASIRTFEKRIAGGRDEFDRWQLLLLKPRWFLPGLPSGQRTPCSLKALVSATNPGFADRLLGAQQIAFATLARRLGHAHGASGNKLMLAIAGHPRTRGEIERLLDQFRTTCVLPGGARISHVPVLSVEGRGRSALLRSVAAAQADPVPSVKAGRDDPSIRGPIIECDLLDMERLADEGRGPALTRYEALQRAAAMTSACGPGAGSAGASSA